MSFHAGTLIAVEDAIDATLRAIAAWEQGHPSNHTFSMSLRRSVRDLRAHRQWLRSQLAIDVPANPPLHSQPNIDGAGADNNSPTPGQPTRKEG